MGNQASDSLSDLQSPSVQHYSEATGSKEQVFEQVLQDMQPYVRFTAQTGRDLESDLKQCEKAAAGRRPRLLELKELLDSTMGLSARLHDIARAVLAVLGEAASRVELLASGDGGTGKRLAKELMSKAQATGTDLAESLHVFTLESFNKRIANLLSALEVCLNETASLETPQMMESIEETRALLAVFAGLWKALKTHKYAFAVSGMRSTDEGIVLVSIENAPFELLSDLQLPPIPHLPSLSGSKPQVFEELLAQLQPYTHFQLQSSRDLDNDLKLCEKALLAQRPRSLQEVREQVDLTMGLSARLCDLTRGFVAAMAEAFGRVEILAKGDEAAGRGLAKELIAKGQADDPALAEVLLVSTLENYKKRIEEQISALERFLRDLAAQSPDFPVVLSTLSETGAVLDTLASLWTSLKGHRFYFVLSSERQIDEADLRVVRGAPVIRRAQAGWNPLLKSALAEQNLSRNRIPGWEDFYIRLKDLYSVLKAQGTEALLQALGEDLDQRVLPRYLQSGREWLERISQLPRVQEPESLRAFLDQVEPVIAAAQTVVRFIGLNLDLVQGLLEELGADNAVTAFVLANWVRAESRWNPLRTLLSLREGHLDLLQRVDSLQMSLQRYKGALSPEELEKAGKLREKLLLLGTTVDDISVHPVFDKVPVLEPKKQLITEQTRDIDLSVSVSAPYMADGLSQPLLQKSIMMERIGTIEPQVNSHRVLSLFLLLATALYNFNYYAMVIPSSLLSRDLHQAVGYGPVFVCLATVGGLLSSGAQRQWVKSSYYEPLRFAVGMLVVGNAGVLCSLAISSQSFSLLSRVLVGAGNPTFLALYFLHCGYKKRERDSPRMWLVLGQVLGTALAFLTSGFLCSFPSVFSIRSELFPAVLVTFLGIALFILLLCLCPEANLHIPVPTIRTQADQNKLILAGVTFALPLMLWECLQLAAPSVFVGLFALQPEQVGTWVLLACLLQFPSYLLQWRFSFDVKTHWGLVAFCLCLCAAAVGLAYSFAGCFVMLCGVAIAGRFTYHPSYTILRAEPPFGENGSWWNADFAMTIAIQCTQLLGGIWAIAVVGLGPEQAVFSLFVPAIVLSVAGFGTVGVLAPKWPFMENPFN